MLHQTTIRLDQETVHAIEQACASERKSQAQFLREAVRMRLDTTAMIEPIRVAVAETIASVKSDLLDSLRDVIVHLLEGAEASAADNKKMLTDFMGALGNRWREINGEAPLPELQAASSKKVKASAPSGAAEFFDTSR